VLGQAPAPRGRLLGISAALSCALLLPASGDAGRGPTAAGLREEHAALESRSRSAVLGLYALDEQLESARARLDSLRARAARLRAE